MFLTHMVTKTAPEERFWRKVQKGGPDDCWPWLGWKAKNGYGRFTPHPTRQPVGRKKSKAYPAHRLAWEYTNGAIPEGVECCHKCDNKPCCNPAHLFIGTHAENMRDCMHKGRLNSVRGSRQGHAKLSELQVVQIRALYIPGVVSMNMLARLFEVSKRAIQFIVRRKSWRHVP